MPNETYGVMLDGACLRAFYPAFLRNTVGLLWAAPLLSAIWAAVHPSAYATRLWPLVVSNSVTTRPLTVGLAVFASTHQGVDWSVISAATLLTAAPLLLASLLLQRQFVQSFNRAGVP